MEIKFIKRSDEIVQTINVNENQITKKQIV